ncbi:MAG: hypothetical protein SV253_04705 [Halobacteria archaeon]|nr:hypothetical protein [Halobacteria archaeon]
MPSQREFDTKLRELSNYVERIGDEVTGEVEGEADGSPLHGYECDHGGHKYRIIGTQDWEYFILRYSYQIYGDYAVAQKLQRAEVPEASEDQEVNINVDLTDQDLQNAKQELYQQLSQESQEEVAQVRQKMIQMLSTPESAISFVPDDSQQIHGFNIDRKIFPYSERFCLSEFNRSVQTVVSLGFKGVEYLKNSYGIRSITISQSSTKQDHLRDPGFR